ncbi:MAG TPA: aminoglycoside phosphotransferase family protein [Thermomicrobiales bacterium]|nr:aminoglycoside phosphotransferase family protein [Thermomicrobiales bacterium]
MPTDNLDPRAILATLGFPNAETVTPVSGGRDTAIFRVEHGTTIYALRVFRSEQQLVSQAEVLAMRAASAGGVPVPGVHAHGVHDGRPALLLDWCEGMMVVEALGRWPEQATALGAASGEVLARIHAVMVPAEYRDHSWLCWGGLAPDDPLSHQLVAFARHDRLLHLDFHPLNVLTDGERITAVLDWANAHAGDPRADLARAISIIRLDAGDLPPEARPILRAFERGLRDGYARAAGSPVDMPLFHIWAGRAMRHDLAPRLSTNPAQAARICRWIRLWERHTRIVASDDSALD